MQINNRQAPIPPPRSRADIGSMKTYPIFAVIEDKPCLVVGGGAVGERKVADLMAAGARGRGQPDPDP